MQKGNLTEKSHKSFHVRVVPLYDVPYPGARLGPYSTREEADSIRKENYQHFTKKKHDEQLATDKQSHASYHTSHFTQSQKEERHINFLSLTYDIFISS
ncbi:hypothetical protein AHAS_Ahas06G0165200 [Arachis hypogaea]